jgi:E1A/CREB-binding protein
MFSRNNTLDWLTNKPQDQQQKLFETATRQAAPLRKLHRDSEKDVTMKRKQLLVERKRAKEHKLNLEVEKVYNITQVIEKQGGPCTTSDDVDRLTMTKKTPKDKIQALKAEIQYHKFVRGQKSRLLKTSGAAFTLAANLKSYLLQQAANAGNTVSCA